METEEFSLFNGKLKLYQPKHGYRVAIDPVLLAASVPKEKFINSRILDMGCGIGTIGFCLLSRFKAEITGIDIQPELIEIAKQNTKQAGDIKFISGDISTYNADNPYDAIVMNPPYMHDGTLAKTTNKRLANAETEDIKFIDWAESAANNLNKGSYLFLIHRADRLDNILKDLQTAEFGSFTVFPLWPKKDVPAKRVIIIARKQKYAPLKLLSGLTLHKNQSYTKEAQEILSNKAELNTL